MAVRTGFVVCAQICRKIEGPTYDAADIQEERGKLREQRRGSLPRLPRAGEGGVPSVPVFAALGCEGARPYVALLVARLRCRIL